MIRSFRVALFAATLVAATGLPLRNVQAAQELVSEALGHEDAGRYSQAIIAYRTILTRALAGDDTNDQIALALLGLERVFHMAAQRDSIVPVLHLVLDRRPADPVARGIQFRAFAASAQDAEVRRAFAEWRRAAPEDAAPWREYVRTLMAMGRPRSADSALADAQRVLGRSAEFAGEAAQIAATLERWNDAAIAWRRTVDAQPWMEMAAAFSLQRTPDASRDSVRAVLAAEPVALAPRRLLATIETGWGDARRGWAALSSVRGDDSTVVAWTEFGDRAEAMGAWSVARDVWRSLYQRTGDAATARRAAQSALSAGDAAEALVIAGAATRTLTPEERARQWLVIEVGALSELGRADEASRRGAQANEYLDEGTRADVSRLLVSAWLRTGDVVRAREAATRAGALEDEQVIGWLALYDGDLAEARRRLVRATQRDAALIDALAVLARTRVARHEGLGAAFLALAKRDTADAITRFAAAADSLEDARPALLATAARLATQSNDTTRAVRYWKQVATSFATSPESPEALLELARAAARSGDLASATARYESLIIDHPGSAMVPQARRELEKLRGRVPELS